MKTTGKYGAFEFSMVLGLLFLVTQAFVGSGTSTGAELKYAGLVNNQPAFRLMLSNSKEDRFLITVKNINNEIFYTNKTNSKNIRTLFQLDSWDLADQNLSVKIENITTGEADVFTINMQTRTVLETKINKS